MLRVFFYKQGCAIFLDWMWHHCYWCFPGAVISLAERQGNEISLAEKQGNGIPLAEKQGNGISLAEK